MGRYPARTLWAIHTHGQVNGSLNVSTLQRDSKMTIFQPAEKSHKSQSFVFLSLSFSAYRWLSKIRQRQRPNEKGRSKWLGTNRRYRSPWYCALGKTFQNDAQIIDHPQKWNCTASYIFSVLSEVLFYAVLICTTAALHCRMIKILIHLPFLLMIDLWDPNPHHFIQTTF